jgi:gluconate 2-dehydrogenase gamma chain
MVPKSLTRRRVLQVLGLGISAGASAPVLVSIESAGHVHSALREEKTRAEAYTPKFFKPDQYELLQALCGVIIPADTHCGGALEAGAPEYIDLLTSENEDYQRRLGGGLMWLNATCLKRYNEVYLECSPAEQKGILDLIAYRVNGDNDSGLLPGIDFFAFLRELSVDAFATSKIGIKYLGYVGNTFLSEFPGCPPIPDG